MATYKSQETNALAAINVLIGPNGTGAIDGPVHRTNERQQTSDAYLNLLAYDNFAYSIARTEATNAANGQWLRDAYTNVKLQTPGGAPLSAINRAAVLCFPGTYALGATGLAVDTEFIDFVGVGAPSDVVITSTSNTATGVGSITKSVDDVIFTNIRFQNNASTGNALDSTDDSGYAPQGVFPNEKFVNCEFYNPVDLVGVYGAPFMRLGVEYAGTYINCVGIDMNGGVSQMFSIASGKFTGCAYRDGTGFGVGGDASGEFRDCLAASGFAVGTGVYASGLFIGCEVLLDAGGFAAGSNAVFSGRAYECKAASNSFGFGVGALTTGSLYRCSAEASSFGDTGIGAYLEDCTVSSLGFGPPSVAATMAGTYVRCRGGLGSFGIINGSVLSGVFIDCIGNEFSFGGGNSCVLSGTFTRCTAANDSFGGGTSCVLSGRFTGCIAENGSFGQQSSTLSGSFFDCHGQDQCFGFGASSATISTLSGLFDHCTGNDDCFGRNSSITTAAVFNYCEARDRSFCQGNNGLSGDGCAGTFNYCKGRDACFGAGMAATIKAAGTFNYCIARNGCFGSGSDSEFSGFARHCVGGISCFGAAVAHGAGQAPIFSGEAYFCTAGESSFGAGTGGENGTTFSGYAKGCVAGLGSFGSCTGGVGDALVDLGARLYDCEGGYESFSLQSNTFGLMRGRMVNCKLTTDGEIGVPDTLSPVRGRMENCQITTTGVNSSALTVTDNARIYGCTLIGDGAGFAVTGGALTTAAIAHCRMSANGIDAGNVTNNIGTPANVVDADITN